MASEDKTLFNYVLTDYLNFLRIISSNLGV